MKNYVYGLVRKYVDDNLSAHDAGPSTEAQKRAAGDPRSGDEWKHNV